MENISEITKRDIFDILRVGIQIGEVVPKDHPDFKNYAENEITEHKITYYGRLNEIDFLSRLYKLEELPSYDGRYNDARSDIWQHTINNSDYDNYWVFSDDRFQLLTGDDKYFLNFICEIFHPAVRNEKENWKLFLKTFEDLLKQDGYEIYEKNNISGRTIYGWRNINSVQKEVPQLIKSNYLLNLLGEGSYAHVYKFKDDYYDKYFVLKRAKRNLADKELIRFKQEYDEMKKLNSNHVVEVYNYNAGNNEYIMEYMDCTLYDYIRISNGELDTKRRFNIVMQLFNTFEYLSDKELLHRDISLTNILLKLYDDVTLVKVSDFGLLKTAHSNLTSTYSEVKGSLNDPQLEVYGFNNYEIRHETYALTRAIYFIMTGRTKIEKFKNQKFKDFVLKGISQDINNRFSSITDMKKEFKNIYIYC